MAKDSIKIKVCGLTKPDQIQKLISMNIDYLGFIFYEKSPRFVLKSLSLEEINAIKHPGKVGVFVNESVGNIADISKKAGLNYVQLHGDEDENFILELRQKLEEKIKIIKVFRIGKESVEELQKNLSRQPSAIDFFLFDTDSKAFGGTGTAFDWKILTELKIDTPYFLSGGISTGNAEDLIHFVKVIQRENKTLSKWNRPFAVDINSKFEIEPGNKDLKKIEKFKSMLIHNEEKNIE